MFVETTIAELTEAAHTVCARVKELGFERSRRVRLYGQEFQLLSDPFPDGEGVAVEAIATNEFHRRRLRLPMHLLRSGRRPNPGRKAA